MLFERTLDIAVSDLEKPLLQDAVPLRESEDCWCHSVLFAWRKDFCYVGSWTSLFDAAFRCLRETLLHGADGTNLLM